MDNIPPIPFVTSTSKKTMSTDPKTKGCVPCQSLDASALLSTEQVKDHLPKSLPLWTFAPADDLPPRLTRSFCARNFQSALEAIQNMGVVAEEENHHPDFHLTNYRWVAVEVYTHKLQGISENDLILAGKLDQVTIDYSPKWLKDHPEALPTAKKIE